MIPVATSNAYVADQGELITPKPVDPQRAYPGEGGEELLRKIRGKYSYFLAQWEDQREAAKRDSLLMANEPFDEREIRRRGKKRPLVRTDQLGQYINQIVNQIKQNPRGVNFSPMDFATDKELARKWANLARGIEKDSDAQAAYSTGFEGAVAYGGMGFLRLAQEFESCESDRQVLRVVRVPNQFSIMPDPDCHKIDFSDMKCCFVLDTMGQRAWLDEYEEAAVTNFGELAPDFPQWIVSDNDLVVAEFWEVIEEDDILLTMESASILKSELPDDAKWVPAHDRRGSLGGHIEFAQSVIKVKSWRKTKVPSVWRHMTNGVEVVESYEWAYKSSSIPIYPIVGREMFVDRGDGPKKQYVSAVRFTSWAIKGMCYVRSLQMEIAQQTPKTPYLAIEGQLEQMEGWKTLNTDPAAFLYYKAKLADYPNVLLPPPVRLPYDPRLEPLEALYQAFKQDLEGALGMYRASVGNQSGSTSGKMVEELDRQSDQGSFHFTHNFNQTLERLWTDIKDRIPQVYDTVRDVGGIRADGTAEVIRLNDPDHEGSVFTAANKLRVSVSVGAAMDQQTKDQQKLAEILAGIPEVMAKAADLVVQLQSNGPQIDAIAERLKPPGVDSENATPSEMQQQLAQTRQQLELATAAVKELQTKIETDQVKAEADFRKEQLRQEHEDRRTKENNERAIEVALIAARSKTEAHVASAVDADAADANADQARAEEHDLQRENRTAEQDHEAAMKTADQEHAATMTAADQEFQAEQTERQAELAPPPAE